MVFIKGGEINVYNILSIHTTKSILCKTRTNRLVQCANVHQISKGLFSLLLMQSPRYDDLETLHLHHIQGKSTWMSSSLVRVPQLSMASKIIVVMLFEITITSILSKVNKIGMNFQFFIT